VPAEVAVEFDCAIQPLLALNAAAYRLIGTATCQINKANDRYICTLRGSTDASADDLRRQFIDLVTDENVRERLRPQMEPVRNLILTLAFGALASKDRS
jgi:His-Xaa-Ser system protein HxsD